MFGYRGTLGPEADKIVRYLVSEVGPDDPVPTHQIAERLNLSDTELQDGVDELADRGLITTHGPYQTHVEPKGGAWLYVDSETLGYDLLREQFVSENRP